MPGEIVEIKLSTLQYWYAAISVADEHGIECSDCSEQLDRVGSEMEAAAGDAQLTPDDREHQR